jgi:hypothetical protein
MVVLAALMAHPCIGQGVNQMTMSKAAARTHSGLIHKLRNAYGYPGGHWDDPFCRVWDGSPCENCAFELTYNRENHAVGVHVAAGRHRDPQTVARLERIAERLRAFLDLAIDLAEGENPETTVVGGPRNGESGATDGLIDHQIVLVTFAEFVAARARGDMAMKYRRIESLIQIRADEGYLDLDSDPYHWHCFHCQGELGATPASFVVSMPLPHSDDAWAVWCACAKCTETQDVLGLGIEAEACGNGLGRLVEPDEDRH